MINYLFACLVDICIVIGIAWEAQFLRKILDWDFEEEKENEEEKEE